MIQTNNTNTVTKKLTYDSTSRCYFGTIATRDSSNKLVKWAHGYFKHHSLGYFLQTNRSYTDVYIKNSSFEGTRYRKGKSTERGTWFQNSSGFLMLKKGTITFHNIDQTEEVNYRWASKDDILKDKIAIGVHHLFFGKGPSQTKKNILFNNDGKVLCTIHYIKNPQGHWILPLMKS